MSWSFMRRPRTRGVTAALLALILAYVATFPPLAAATGVRAAHITIRFSTFTWAPYVTKDYMALIAAFEKAHPNVTVKPELVPVAAWAQKLAVEVASGNIPDVISIDPQHFAAYAAQHVLLDLTPYLQADKQVRLSDFASPYLINAARWPIGDPGGRIMAIPNGGGTIALYYNKTLFDRARLAYPTSHWTWQDMLTAARKITNHKTNTWGLLFTPGAMEYSLDQMVWGNGGGTVVDIAKHPPKCTLTQPAATEAIQFMADAIYKWKVAPRYGFAPATTASTPGGTAFGTGKIGMYFDGDWMVQAYHSQIKSFQWDIAYPPVGPHGTKPVTNVEIGWLVVARTTNHPREAYEFAKFYGATDEGQIKFQLPIATVDRVSALRYQIAHQSPPPAHYRIIAPMMRYGRFEWGTLWAQVDTTLTNDLNTTLSADPAHNRQVIARACADVDRVLATVKTR